MEIDLDLAEARSEPFRSRVCVIGAGVAGLVLAYRLSRQGIDVALLEAGGHTLEARSQSLFTSAQFAAVQHLGAHEGRFRIFGGSSTQWGGQILPMQVEHEESPWPLSAAALEPFYAEVQRLLGVDGLPFEAEAFFAATGVTSPSLLATLPEIDVRYSKWAPFARRNLATTIGHDLVASTNKAHGVVTLFLHANVTEVLLAAKGDRAEAVLARNYTGTGFRFEAEHFVVAAGTIETSRLLLASRSIQPQGIGNAHDQVGRYFHDHLSLVAASPIGEARAQLLRWLAPYIFDGTVHTAKLEASPALRQRLQLNAILAHLTLDEPEDSGIAVVREMLQSRQRGGVVRTLLQRAPQLPASLLEASRLAWHAKVHHRRFVSAKAAVSLRLNVEQEARPDSRILLSADRDALGMPLAIVDWKISAAETSTLRRFAGYLREHLASLDPAEMQWNAELQTESANLSGIIDVFHAMGGTQMGNDPRASVVDTDLTVHGVANLSIASASTFPTGGSQLPTLPLMALALRLADRLVSSL
ncbi:FAD-dependent oxidoreductase [Granulicella sp. S156]|uniref:FAD-dependent oxidoreductase n=1 Tax=Granulicella sp. S156 TaxID=1747224 RepID=UPI00131B731B|nr:GMC family oxidoreductase [Granulicella sp. S156]